VKTTKELENKDGITLGEMIGFVAECSAAGMPNGTRMTAKVGFRSQLRNCTLESTMETKN
jgi:hypothetical protein